MSQLARGGANCSGSLLQNGRKDALNSITQEADACQLSMHFQEVTRLGLFKDLPGSIKSRDTRPSSMASLPKRFHTSGHLLALIGQWHTRQHCRPSFPNTGLWSDMSKTLQLPCCAFLHLPPGWLSSSCTSNICCWGAGFTRRALSPSKNTFSSPQSSPRVPATSTTRMACPSDSSQSQIFAGLLQGRLSPTPDNLPACACQIAAGVPIDHSILNTVLQGHTATAERCTVGCSSAPGSCCFACNLDVSHRISWLWIPPSPFRAAEQVLCMLLLDQSLTFIFDRMRFP